MQSFVLASLSAAIIALPVTLESISHNRTALLHDLLWPDTLDPYVVFSLMFIGIVPPLLGYYHLGRLGFLSNVAAGFVLAWLLAVLGIVCFKGADHYFGSLVSGAVCYFMCFLLVHLVIGRIHLRVASSSSIRNAQLKLRLLRSGL
jgi:hypothetical protein